MPIDANNFVTSFVLNGSKTAVPLTLINAAIPPASLTGTYAGVNNQVALTILTYESGTMTTPTFISQITASLIELSGLSTNTSLTDYGNAELKSLIDTKSAAIQVEIGLMDPLLPYSGNILQTKAIKFTFLNIKRGVSAIMTSGEFKLTVLPSVSPQTSVGGVETARPKSQTLSLSAEKISGVMTMLKKLYNNDMNLASGVSQIGYSITGQKSCYSANTAEINRLRWEIYRLQVSRATATPDQQIVIDAQIANLNAQINVLEAQDRTNCNSYNTDPVLSIEAIRAEVNSILGLGNSAKISLTGKVSTYTGTPAQPIYPCNPCSPCVPCSPCYTSCNPYCPEPYVKTTTTKRWPNWWAGTTTTTTKNSQIVSLENSIANAKNQLTILTNTYNQKVSAGTATQADLQAYTSQYATLSASIESMENQLANLKRTYTNPYYLNVPYLNGTTLTTNQNWWSTQKMSTTQLNKALNSLAVVDGYVDMNDETTPGILSFLNVTVTQSGEDISINYLMSIQDKGYSVSVSGAKTGTFSYYGANFLSSVSTLTNSQKSNICKLFGIDASSAPTNQDMWNTFCVAFFTYPAIAIFIVATVVTSGQFVDGTANLGIETLLTAQSISSMSNGSIPAFAGICFEDSRSVMNFGVLKTLVSLINDNETGGQELVNATVGLVSQGINVEFLA